MILSLAVLGVNYNEKFLEIGKAIHGVKMRLDEPMAWEALSYWFKPSRCQFSYQRPGTQKLASGAEAGATVLYRDPFDGAAANWAGTSFRR